MSKYNAVITISSTDWYEIVGVGTFIVSYEHPMAAFSSMHACLLNRSSPSSNASVNTIFRGNNSTFEVKAKIEPSNTPKVYLKAPSYQYVKIIPLSGNINVNITNDIVE